MDLIESGREKYSNWWVYLCDVEESECGVEKLWGFGTMILGPNVDT